MTPGAFLTHAVCGADSLPDIPTGLEARIPGSPSTPVLEEVRSNQFPETWQAARHHWRRPSSTRGCGMMAQAWVGKHRKTYPKLAAV